MCAEPSEIRGDGCDALDDSTPPTVGRGIPLDPFLNILTQIPVDVVFCVSLMFVSVSISDT